MSLKLPLFVLAAVVVGVFFGNVTFATSPEIGGPRPVQQGVSDLVNNSSWNQVSYLVHDWWLGNAFGPVHIENLESSGLSREIVFLGELTSDTVAFGEAATALSLDWSNEDLVSALLAYRLLEDGHLIYCREDGMDRRTFCSFNVFLESQPDANSVLQMVGVDLGPFGVGLVEKSLLDRVIKKYSAPDVDAQGSP